jgi:5-enolpyruvylshikimate-3-phosphate synthase
LRTADGFRVIGTDMRHSAPRATLNARESGSTLRFLIPIAGPWQLR